MTAYAVEGLLFVVNGEEPENHRADATHVEGCDAVGDALANVVEVWGVAAYYRAEHYNGVGFVAVNHACGGVGELYGSGNFVTQYVSRVDAVGQK